MNNELDEFNRKLKITVISNDNFDNYLKPQIKKSDRDDNSIVC